MKDEPNQKVYDIDIFRYLKLITDLLLNRFNEPTIDNAIEFEKITKNGKNAKLGKVTIHFSNGHLVNDQLKEYSISLKEVAIPFSEKKISSNKYSFEIRSNNDKTDFFRFDFKPSDEFPNHHINVDETRFGLSHLTYPDGTNLKLENLNFQKAVSLFQRYVKHPEEIITDKDNNAKYVEILDMEGFYDKQN